jgi:hypothetical protein
MVSGSSDHIDMNHASTAAAAAASSSSSSHGHPSHLAPLPYLPDGFGYDGGADGSGVDSGDIGDTLFDAYEEMFRASGGGGGAGGRSDGHQDDYLHHQLPQHHHTSQPITTNDGYYLDLLRMAPHLAASTASGGMSGASNAQQMALTARLNEFMGRMRDGRVDVVKDGVDGGSPSGQSGVWHFRLFHWEPKVSIILS